MRNRRLAKLVLLSILVALFGSAPIFADMFSPSHMCSKPRKPFQFDSQWEIDNFVRDVDRYKECISNFVDEQNEAVRKHRQAADEAIDEWNSFVEYELN